MAKFDTTTCRVCGFMYVSGYDRDMREHRKRHDRFVHGIKAPPLKTDRILHDENGLRITVVTPESPLVQRQRAERVAFRAKRDTPFDFASYHAKEPEEIEYPCVLLATRAERAIGYLVLRRYAYFCETTWKEYTNPNRKGLPTLDGERWSVGMVWVLAGNRSQGLATRLLEHAVRFVGIPLSALAWSTPFTEYGERLARRHFPEQIAIT